MRVRDLNGELSNWQLPGYLLDKNRQARSALHLQCRELLIQLFPTLHVFEEVPIRVRPKEILYLDFYIKLRNCAVEVHGEQHYKFISFYHHTPIGFAKAKQNDIKKSQWCALNNIKLITLPYNESLDEWTSKFR